MAHAASVPSLPYRLGAGASAGQALAGATDWLDAALQGTAVPPLVLVIGLGDGSLLDVLDARAPSTKVLALEPDASVAAACRARPIAQRWLASGRLVYLVDPDYSGSDRAWRLLDGVAAHAVLTHPDLRIEAESAVRAARTLKNIVFGARANAAARRKFAPRYLVNALRNIPPMLRGRDVQTLAGAYRGVPAVITAAGPSLDEVMPDVHEAAGRALIVATDTSLRPLLHAGLAPPLVVALDPGEANARHFQSLPDCGDTWLVSESALDPRATAVFGDRVFWFRAGDHQPWTLLTELGLPAARLDVWGSVLTGAFQVACLAGCDPIVFVGADLAYTGGRPYARGTTYEFDWAWHTGNGAALDEVWRGQIERRDLQTEADVRGEPTQTTPSLLSFRDWLLARAQHSGRRIVNATGAGMLFGPGIEQLPLLEALQSRVEPRPLTSLPRRGTTVRPSAIATRLRRLGDHVRGGDRPAPVDAWAAFSGDGFDPAAISTALEEAAHAIETKRGVRITPTLVPWRHVAACAPARRMLRGLPEAVARFRRLVLHAQELQIAAVADPSAAEREALLGLALDLLSAVVTEAGRGDDVFPVSNPANVAISPVSTQFHWPEHVRWAVQLFEAILGTAADARTTDASRMTPADPSVHDQVGLDEIGDPDPRPNTSFAILQLALQWIRSVAPLIESATIRESMERVMTVAPRAPTHATGPGSDVLLIQTRSRTTRIPLGRGAMSRLGAPVGADASVALGEVTLSAALVTLDVTSGRNSLQRAPTPRAPRLAS